MKKKELTYIKQQLQIQNVSEIGIHYISKGSKIQMATSATVYKRLFDWWNNTINITETFAVMLLNRINNEIGIFELSRGGISGTVTDVRLICAVALLSGASHIILAHNHPSGNLKPSETDIRITNKAKESLSIMDISLLDHLIISPEKDQYFSFTDNNLIEY
jgi:DNA repair protein RadC